MSKGESDWLLLPSSPKGEIVGIMIHMLYLMATHSSQMINYSAAKFTEFYAEKGLFHVEKSSRNFMSRKVYKILFHVEKISRNFMQRKVYFMWENLPLVHGS